MNKNILIALILCGTAIIISYFAFSNKKEETKVKDEKITPASLAQGIKPADQQIMKDTANLRVRYDTTDGKKQWVSWTDGHAVNSYIVQESNGKKYVFAKTMETLFYDSAWKQITSKNVIR